MGRLSGLAGRGLSALADFGRATALGREGGLGAGAVFALPNTATRPPKIAGRTIPDELGDRQPYELHAPTYDVTSAVGMFLRARAVEALAPRQGEVIFDVGCGTGLNFDAIEQGIGPRGRLVGIDRSPAMLRRAKERIALNGWRNATLLAGAGDLDALDVEADGVLFCLAHDVLRSPEDLARTFAKVRPGGRVVAAGAKWAPLWAMPVNVATWFVNLAFITSFEGFERPWDHLARFLRVLQVESLTEYFGGAYVARGTVRSDRR